MQYPGILRRYLASIIDLIVVILIAWAIFTSPIDSTLGDLDLVVFLVILLIYEPLAATFACTAGQFLMRFRVRTFEKHEKMGIAQAYARYFVKLSLGVVSLLLIPTRSDRRSIHDIVAKTIVLEAKDAIYPSNRWLRQP
jgi:uncharacterized RDD family membrane protein YckC